jgi:hypothetical protein
LLGALAALLGALAAGFDCFFSLSLSFSARTNAGIERKPTAIIRAIPKSFPATLAVYI